MMLRFSSLSLALGAWLGLLGCSAEDAHTRPLPDAGSTASDAGSTAPDAGASACGLPIESGPCEAAIPRYAFDAQQGRCVQFVYGGCGGNSNSFESMAECVAACGGPSEVACGGWSGDTCTEAEFCDFATHGCDWADASGICRPRPEACDTDYNPVCGCDGKTYSNLCAAHSAGTDAAQAGACAGGCPDGSRDPILVGGRHSFGFCAQDCVADLSIVASELDVEGACDMVELEVCDNGREGNCTTVRGELTAAGHDAARAVAAALEGVPLDSVYGCPDCADGGATSLRLRRQGAVSEHSYDFRGPPEVLGPANALLDEIIAGMRACTSGRYVVPESGCAPR